MAIRPGVMEPTFSTKARAAREERNARIVAMLATERTTSELVAELRLHPRTVTDVLRLLQLEGRVRARFVAKASGGTERAWKATAPATEHVPHLPRSKASRDAATNAAACGYDTREERAADRLP